MYLRPISMPGVTTFQPRAIANTQETPDLKQSFTSLLQKATTTLDQLDRETVMAQADLVSGNARDMHTAAISAEKASLALDLVVSVRNKAIEAYQEIMRMPV